MTVWIESPFDNLPSEGFRKQRFWLMAEAFVRAGWKVVYWTGDFNHGTKARRIEKLVRPSGVEVRLFPTRPYPRNVCWSRIVSHRDYGRQWLMAAENEPPPNVIIAATPTVTSAVTALKLARQTGAKLVIDVMDAWPETFERLAPPSLKWLVKLMLAPLKRQICRAYRQADLVTGVSERYRAIVERDDYYLAPHGVEIGGESPRRIEIEENSLLQLVYAGNLGEGYDLKTVIAAVERMADTPITLDIAGAGPHETELRELVARKGLENRVRFHGYVGADALEALLRQCQIGVIPMRDDSWVGLPYKLGDYATAGLKVVSSLHGETGRLLERCRAGTTYEWGNAESLIAAIRAVAEMRGANGLAAALDAKTIYAKYVERVEKLVK